MQIASLPQAAAQKVNVVAHIDASEEVVEPFLAKRLDEFESAKTEAGNDLNITGQVIRKGSNPTSKVVKGLAILGAQAALPVAGFMLGGPIGLGVGLLGAGAMYAIGLTRQGLGEIESARYHRQCLPDGDWSGRRIYTVTADDKPGIASAMLSEEASTKAPSTPELARYFADNMDRTATNIVFVSGHGLGFRNVASMPTGQVARALNRANELSGQTPDVLIMESCLMGNLETLEHLKGTARVAVLSEEVLMVDALPLKDMLVSASKDGGTPQEIGQKMVELAGATGNIQTLAAFDLSKLDDFNASLDNLGTKLQGELAGGNRAEIQAAAKEAGKFPQPSMLFLERALLNFSDFGSFLEKLDEKNLSAETKTAAQETKARMEDMIVAKTTGKGYENASGVSFLKKDAPWLAASPDMGSYDETPNLPNSWKSFTKELWAA